jgi:hypothetical protein
MPGGYGTISLEPQLRKARKEAIAGLKVAEERVVGIERRRCFLNEEAITLKKGVCLVAGKQVAEGIVMPAYGMAKGHGSVGL